MKLLRALLWLVTGIGCRRRGRRAACGTSLFLAGVTAQAQVNYPDFSNPTNLLTQGTATTTAGILRLTTAEAHQNGSAHFGDRLPLMSGFETVFTFRITGASGVLDEQNQPGGDGFAFIIHKQNPDEANPVVGYMPYSLQDCIAVEFDTWDNGNLEDPNGNHVSIQSVGAAPDFLAEFHHNRSLGWGTPGANLSDGAVHTARIRYEGQTLQVFVDNQETPVVSVSLNFTNISGRSALDANALGTVGLVAGTGAAFEQHDILSWSLQPAGAPVITNQPLGRSGKLCGDATFTVGARGFGSLSYQWRREGNDLPGETSSTLTLNNLTLSAAGTYSVLVSNTVGTTLSSGAYLYVDDSTAGADKFAEATPLCVEFASFYGQGFNYSATTEPGESLLHASRSQWWKLAYPPTDTYILDTAGSTFDSAIAVYTGTDFATLSLVGSATSRFPVPANGDGSAFLKIPLSGSQVYWICVYSENDSSGVAYLLGIPEQRPTAGVDVYGLSPENVITNGDAVQVGYQANGPYEFLGVQVFDNNRRIYSAEYQQIGNAFDTFDWSRVPLGPHSLRLEAQNPNVANGNVVVSGPSFTVVGREVGFAAVKNLIRIPASGGELLDFSLAISNRAASATGPLRLSFVEAATALLRARTSAENVPPPMDQTIAAFPPLPLPSLASGGGLLVPVSNNIVCKAFLRDDQLPAPVGIGSEGLQFHVDALLEEQRDGVWIALDRTRICSSELNALSPPNEGVTGQDGPVNNLQANYILAPLLIEGPTNLLENSSTSLVARVRLSNNTTNLVTPAWSVNPPFSIDATGRLTAPTLAASSNALITATYTRSIQTLTATKDIAVLKVIVPEVLQLKSPQVVAGRFQVTIKGAANQTYQILSGTNVLGMSLLQSITTDAQGQALLDVAVTNTTGGKFFRAQRTGP